MCFTASPRRWRGTSPGCSCASARRAASSAEAERPVPPPLALPVKERDAVWTAYVIDPLAAPLVARLRGVRAVTPNRLTVCSALVALVAALAFAVGPLLVGAALSQLSFLLDCMDGKLAAARGERNPNGRLYDVISDCTRLAACATGLAVALRNDAGVAPVLATAYVGIRF